MKLLMSVIMVFGMFFQAEASCRGCCSHHGGVACNNGVTMCRDGSGLSAKCRAKGCEKCPASSRASSSAQPKSYLKKPLTKINPEDSPVASPVIFKSEALFYTFRNSKKFLKRLYNKGGTSFYCQEQFKGDMRFPSFKYYKPKNPNSKRSKRVEWEHVVPAENFGRHFKEWREGHPKCRKKNGRSFKGRNCARKMSRTFKIMEADPINLVPAIGELNGLRSNYRYREIPEEARAFGTCDVEIEKRSFEPRDAIKGDVARIYRYMQEFYNIPLIGKSNKKLFEAWEKLDPPSVEECERIKGHGKGKVRGIFREIFKEDCR